MKTLTLITFLWFTKLLEAQPLNWELVKKTEKNRAVIVLQLENNTRKDIILPISRWLYFDLRNNNEFLPYKLSSLIGYLIVSKKDSFPNLLSNCTYTFKSYSFYSLKPKEKISFEFMLPESISNNIQENNIEFSIGYIKAKRLKLFKKEKSSMISIKDKFMFYSDLKGIKCGNLLFNKEFQNEFQEKEINVELIDIRKFKVLKIKDSL
jgi:hypothetical protein